MVRTSSGSGDGESRFHVSEGVRLRVTGDGEC